MVTVLIGNKAVEIEYKDKKIYRDGEPVSEDESREFEEEILCKKLSKASKEEFEKAVQDMAEELEKWIEGQDKWLNWKFWAAGI